MEKFINLIQKLKKNKNAKKQFRIITFACIILLILTIIKDARTKGRYIVDRHGNTVAIERASKNPEEIYEFELLISDRSGTYKKPIKIIRSYDKGGIGESRKENSDTEDKNAKEMLIKKAINEIENSDAALVKLPKKLEDGTGIKWIKNGSGGGTWKLIPMIYIMLLIIMAKQLNDSESGNYNLRYKEIMKGLPRFTSQLLLMMNAGMILSDSFSRICTSYSIMKSENRGQFENDLIKLNENNCDGRLSTAELINEYAAETGVKELIRIATILYENEKRGIDVIENLERESGYLWDRRKIIAKERGKMIDAKMAYPLGALLIVLIVITMSPALLSM